MPLKLTQVAATAFGTLRQLVFGESNSDANEGNAWVVEDGTGAGRVTDALAQTALGAILAALNALGLNTLPDNRCLPSTTDLTAAHAALSLGLAGRNLNVLGLDGAAQLQFVNAGGTYALTDIYPADRFNFEFTDVLLTNLAQPGKTLTLLASWRA